MGSMVLIVALLLLTLHQLAQHFAISTEIQTLVWFGATIVGVPAGRSALGPPGGGQRPRDMRQVTSHTA